MKRVFHGAVVIALASGALVLGQGGDAAKILAAARAAMGGDALAATTSLAATGRLVKFTTGAPTDPSDFEMAMELPDKFFRKDVIAVISDNTISRTAGFNGDGLIEAIETPPGLFGGMAASGTGRVMVRSGDGATTFGSMGAPPSPEAAAASRKASVLANKQDFARLTLGLFAASFTSYPLEFAMDTPAATADGKSNVIVVKGEGDFVAKLFVDRDSHLPVMLTWMAREPIVRNMSTRTMAPGGATVVTATGGTFVSGDGQAPAQAAAPAPPEERRIVEFKMAYGEYKVTGGVKMPTHMLRTIDGKQVDELVLDKIALNPKIDGKKFDVVK
jgi:hypothetical protein